MQAICTVRMMYLIHARIFWKHAVITIQSNDALNSTRLLGIFSSHCISAEFFVYIQIMIHKIMTELLNASEDKKMYLRRQKRITIYKMAPSIQLANSLFPFRQLQCSPRNEVCPMMTSLNGNTFRVNGPLCGEFTGHRWIPRTKASDADLWCFLWSAPE